MDDRRKKGEFVGALGALLVHVAVIALLILVSFTVPQPDEDAGGVPVMLGNVESARGFDDPSLVDVDILPEEPEAPAPAETQPELPSEQDLLTQTEEETVVLKPKTEPKKETVKPKEVVKPKEPVKKPEKTEASGRLHISQPDEDAGGVPVMLGNVESARGFDDPSLVDVDILPEEPEAPAPAETQPELPSEQDLLTQTEEETVVLKPKTEPKKETVKPKEVVKPKEPVKKPEKTEAEKAAEAKRLAEEKAERERKAAEEAAKKKVANAFGKGAQMGGSKGTSASGTGTEGSKDGNSSTGAKTGTGGYGTFDLGGRSLGTGSLPKPAYNVPEEGRVVVNITVNPAGVVIGTSINPQTNTVNSTLRKAAEDAAKKARFNTVEGPNNQTGTITYYFNLR